MRAGFLAGVLLLAGAYAYVAFAGLDWLSSAGRLGPGFFPRLIGVALVAFAAGSLLVELRHGAREAAAAHWRAAAALAGATALFVAGLSVLGGLGAMLLFMAVALAAFNRGRWLQNVLLAVLLPAAIYLLFRVWLNAAWPRGLLPL